jgi:pyruvate kinase
MKRTKIICTLGPAVESEPVMRQIILEGMDVARLNFSHGNHEEHMGRVLTLKKLRAEMKRPVALLLDTKGPEVRIRTFAGGSVDLVKDQQFTLTSQECEGTVDRVSVTYARLHESVRRGTRILIDDGLVEMRVLDVVDQDVICQVLNSGTIKDRKGINIPGVRLDMPYMSDKDTEDVIFAAENDFDYVAASFARSAADINELRQVLSDHGGANIQVIAKIENWEGVEHIDEILMAADGIMVARGDMGVEIDFTELPRIQKMLIKKAQQHGKKSITATQMLESMISKPRPTRAEISDVANAIYDGTSAIMLSGETSIGRYPVECVRTMAQIAERTEAAIHYVKRFNAREAEVSTSITNAISHATCATAHELQAKAIVTVTKTGSTARLISKYRPACPIIGCTSDEKVWRQLSMSWGVYPILAQEQLSSENLFERAVEIAAESGLVKTGDLVVITAGLPLGVPGMTNILKAHVVGNVLLQATGVGAKCALGTLCVCKSEEEALERFNAGEILVIPETSNRIMNLLRHARGIVTERGGQSSHAAIVGLSLDIPVNTGATHATDLLRSGLTVELDASTGTVYSGERKVE